MKRCSIIATILFGSSLMFGAGFTEAAERNFGEDVRFLAEYVQTIVLGNDPKGPRLAVVPAYQGRVMTSTAKGDAGTSFGWINYDHIASGENAPHINVYGGEERFWLGPEGGQFSIFFPPGAEFTLEQWQTPPVIDTVPYNVVRSDANSVLFRHEAELTNYSRTKFKIRIEREVTLLTRQQLAERLNVEIPQIPVVAYETRNRVTNIGDQAWSKPQGGLSIWLLGMYKHGPKTTVVIPFHQGSEANLGPIVNDEYFGKVPADRLKVGDGVLFFSGDGQYRSKIGLNPRRATNRCGSYDAARGVLTCVHFNHPGGDVVDYVNSMWEIQQQPYAGDAVNSYNDGPPAPGAKPLGPFYELETSSPALLLGPGASYEHVQVTSHLEGEPPALDPITQGLFDVPLEAMRNALQP